MSAEKHIRDVSRAFLQPLQPYLSDFLLVTGQHTYRQHTLNLKGVPGQKPCTVHNSCDADAFGDQGCMQMKNSTAMSAEQYKRYTCR